MAYTAQFDEDRPFGVEVEVYRADRFSLACSFIKNGLDVSIEEQHRNPVPYWLLADDGSIVEPNPAELVSPVLWGTKGLHSIAQAVSLMRVAGCMVGEDCGLHIHHDISDFTGNQLLSLLRLYTKYERVIDYLVAPHRRENHCEFARTMWHKNLRPKGRRKSVEWVNGLAVTQRPLALEIAGKFMVNYGLKRVSSYPSARHHKLNLCSVLTKGTVEFRQHEGTVDEIEVCQWVVLTQLMVNRAKAVKTDPEIKDISVESFIKTLGLNKYNNPFSMVETVQERYYQNKINEQQRILQDSGSRRKSSVSDCIDQGRKTVNSSSVTNQEHYGERQYNSH